MTCPAACSLAISRAICSWPAASFSILCRTAARSCAIVSSSCNSGERAVGEAEAANEDAGIAKAIEQFNVEPGQRDGLIVVRRGS